MNKPTSFPLSPARILGSERATQVAQETAVALGDQLPETAPAKVPSSRLKMTHEKIVRPPLAMRYSHF